MNNEIPLQHDLFSGELVDTRTRAQKKRDQERVQPQPTLLFSQREIAQFGVSAHPLLPLSDRTQLALSTEDHRTPEDIARDTQREAEQKTCQLFPSAIIVRPDLRPVAICLVDFSVNKDEARAPRLLTAGPTLRLLAAGESSNAQTTPDTDEDAWLFTTSQVLRLPFSVI